ncbi:polysaccharide deacetylase family protein [Flavobacterium granuli]|uniref:Polysaccharide deacetylase n=1 Tax=Flavobacterium granuli TaxID=280093 RepID=A0A1M5KIS9_9FLAO|nr:polysaccharide deacetylase family protein [Flavobacterium granuli]PRZ26293.1 polysaccharide deacetylase [Flavobacterium granuli]SHG52103.1 Polysaccharide deacetylase [Flavobacterium granuli]
MKKSAFYFFICISLVLSCQKKEAQINKEISKTSSISEKKTEPKLLEMANSATILSKKEVPVLCYHRIRKILAGDSSDMKTYSVTPEAFAEQMKALHDNGYQTILPDQLYDYLVYDAPLPTKPVMITFDDTREEQFTIGAAEMKKQGLKGVFFIMTVSINRPNYMTKDQIKSLADNGHVIAAHTWDHHMVTKYSGEDWNSQLVKPKRKLEEIIGKPVDYFAYPFGLWNKEAIPEVKKAGYKMAFILSAKRDSIDPLYTIRRIIVPGGWSAESLLKNMESSFNKQQ